MPENVIKYIRTPDGTTYDVRDDSKIETSLMGTANGVATLGSDGKLSSSQLPSSTYTWEDITNKPETATRWPAWGEVTGKPATFYTLPLAANGTRGGVQVGYAQSGKNYPVQLSSEKMYVNVPWTADGGNAATVNGKTVETSVPANAVFTDTKYNFSGNTFYSGGNGVAEHDANNAIKNGSYYYTHNGPATSLGAANDGALYVQQYSDVWVAQIAQDYRNGNLFVRGKNNGTWQAWKKPDAGSVNGYTVEKSVPSNAVFTDTNTWRPIKNNLTSTSTTESLSAEQGRLLANGSARDSTKLPLAGGTMTGNITRGSVTGVAYIAGVGGSSALHVNKGEGSVWFPMVSTRTAGGGGWAIGNYADENLQFVYGTKANISSGTNTTTIANLPARNGTICYTDQAVSSISRSGTTFTATRANGTTFTFDQQDSNTWRPVQNNLTSTSTTDCLSAAQGKALQDNKLDTASVSKSKSIAKNSSISLGMGNNTVALAVSYNGNAAVFMGAWLIIGASGTPSITTLKSASAVTLTANSNGTITVKNSNTSYAASFYIFSLNRSAGSISL